MGKRVLAVDDSASVRQLQHLVLTQSGYEVVQAVDGKDALAQLDKSPPVDLILTDLNMPNLDGLGLIRAVRSGAQKRVPIVIITTELDQARRQEARTAGATGWIVKPFTPEQLIAVIKKLVG
jgi:two-component system chemotaxis response regulator CheY